MEAYTLGMLSVCHLDFPILSPQHDFINSYLVSVWSPWSALIIENKQHSWNKSLFACSFFNRMHWCILLQLPFWKDVHFPFVSNMGVMRLNFNRFHTKNCFKKNDQTHINCLLNVFLIVMIIAIFNQADYDYCKIQFCTKNCGAVMIESVERKMQRQREHTDSTKLNLYLIWHDFFFFTYSLSLALSIPPSLARSLCL